MADVTLKQLDLVGRAISLAAQLDDLVYTLESLNAEYIQAGAVSDELLAGNPPSQHLTLADFTTLVGRYAELTTWFNADFRADIVRLARR